MKKKRYCVMCAGEITLDYALRERQAVCPHCNSILRFKRNLFGRERISAHRPANEEDNTVITVQFKAPNKREVMANETMV